MRPSFNDTARVAIVCTQNVYTGHAEPNRDTMKLTVASRFTEMPLDKLKRLGQALYTNNRQTCASWVDRIRSKTNIPKGGGSRKLWQV